MVRFPQTRLNELGSVFQHAQHVDIATWFSNQIRSLCYMELARSALSISESGDDTLAGMVFQKMRPVRIELTTLGL